MLSFLRKIKMAIAGFFAGVALLLSVRLLKSKKVHEGTRNRPEIPPKPEEKTEDIEKEREKSVTSAREEYEDIREIIKETERKVESASSNVELAEMWNDFLDGDKK